MKPVAPENISVVIQGPLYRNLSPSRNIFACIASIKKHLPGAEIIVSTWRQEDTGGLEVDQVIALDDPGYFLDVSGNQINTNRMLHSTLSGIQAATRRYVMKLRADHNLTSTAFAVVGESGPIPPEEPKLFETPITLTTLYIRDPKQVPMLFHLSDLVQFGKRDDMLKLWNQPLLKETDALKGRPSRNPFGNFTGYSAAYTVPEQCIMLGAMRAQGIDVRLKHPCQVSMENLELWESILRCNFRVLDYAEAGIDFPERLLNSTHALRAIYKASDIEQLHRLRPTDYRLKILRIWFNQYFLGCLRPAWWVSLASIILFSASPRLAKTMRSSWRKHRKVVHPDSNRT